MVVERHLAEEKVAAEVEEGQRAEEAKACQIAEERVVAAAVARQQAVLDVDAKQKAEAKETGMEKGGGSPSRQKERAEGEQVT